ncbi:MAG: DUF255 domain-containing protein [Dehalococcoidia bacterium]|nr:DUF255 domain-containing protein [Dehalococcoidia bacterium]
MTTSHHDSPFHFSPRTNRAAEIPWREWGPEAFAEAQADDRPVLLSISATWCHWCHVMDETAYSDPRVIDLIARRFLPVRVDADQRPDVDARYNAGGYPSTAFLTSEGDPITSTTYMDAEQMLAALERVQESWLVNRDGIVRDVDTARATREAERAMASARRNGGGLSPAVLDMAMDALEEARDTEHGGYRVAGDGARTELRFPPYEALRLLRYAYRRRDDDEALEHARATLRGMLDGAIFDADEGGIFRYATRPDWSEPHYEKLGRDQGRLLQVLGEWALSAPDAREEWRRAAEQTIEYLEQRLSRPSGGFHGSQDADPLYYALDPAARAEAAPPAVDARTYADATAVIARGLLVAGIAFDRSDWVERGLRAVDFLVSRMRGGEAGMYHAWDSSPSLLGLLGDQVHSMLALLDAYQVTGSGGYLEQARSLARSLDARWREPGRGFWDVSHDHEWTGLLAHPEQPQLLNADAAEAFLWLGRLVHDERYIDVAHEVLGEFAPRYLTAALGSVAAYARVVDRVLSAEPEIKVVAEYPPGEPDRGADPLIAAALRLPVASLTVQRLHGGPGSRDTGLLESLSLPLERTRVAYVCFGHTCSAPLTEPEQLMPAIEEMLSTPVF